MLSVDEQDTFNSHGLVKLPKAIELTDAGRMSDAVWSFLSQDRGVDRCDPATWTNQRPSGFQPLTRSGALDRVWTPTVCDALEALLGQQERQIRERVRVLMTFPQRTSWTVPGAGWHFDYTPLQEAPGPRAVQIFALLEDVHPRGGGTLVLTGSHRLVSDFIVRTGKDPNPRTVRTDLDGAHPWLAALWDGENSADPDRTARFLNRPELIGGVPIKVVELTGQAGDVFVMHSDCFHAVAPNSLDVARVMCTSLVTRRPESRR